LRPLKFVIWSLIGFACIAQASAGESQFLPPRPATEAGDPIAVLEPQAKLLIIYLPGSGKEFKQDRCLPMQPDSYWGVAPVIASLAGRRIAGQELLVFAFCGPTRRGGYDEETRSGHPKVTGRAADLAVLLKQFDQRGIEPRQIFLAGHSAGAWAALLTARQNQQMLNATIAFAPAFAGPRSGRSPGWRALRGKQAAGLSQATRLDALVYAFRGDRFNRPRDLAFLWQIEGVEFHAMPSDEIGGIDCAGTTPHHVVRHDCFAAAEQARIVDYITRRFALMD